MTKQEFIEYYKKNKVVVIGVPVIIMVVLLDFFVLKPARLAKKQQRAGGAVTTTQAANPTAAAGTGAVQPGQKAPITPAPPLKMEKLPELDKKIETRFTMAKAYPYQAKARNVFIPVPKEMEEIIPQVVEEEVIFERPDITYHGFFTMGKEKVAIIKLAEELVLSKTGAILKHSPYKLRMVLPEKVIISDITEPSREFDVALAEKSAVEKD